MSNVEPLVQPSSISDDQISSYVAYSAPTENDDIIFKQTTGNKQYVVKSSTSTERNFLNNIRNSSISSLSKWLSVKRDNNMMKDEVVDVSSGQYADEALNYEASQCLNGNMSTEKKVLTPYSTILKLLGLRNFGSYDNICHRILSWLWTFLILIIIITGYITNIIVCQGNAEKMDDDKYEKVCLNRSVSYNYIEGMCRSSLESTVPSIIHFVAIVYTFWVFRIKHSEQVEALVQKALVVQSAGTNQGSRTSFIQRLKIVYATGYVFLLLLFAFTVINAYFGKSLVWWQCTKKEFYIAINDTSRKNIDHYFMGLLVSIPSFAIFTFLTPILLNFNIQARLIEFLINELRTTMREKRSTLKAMMQEAHDISTFVHKMNSESSPAMSFILFYLAYGTFVDMYSVIETINEAEHVTNIFHDHGCKGLPLGARDICRNVKLYGRISFIVVIARDIVLLIMFMATVYQGCKIATTYKKLVNQGFETRVFGHTSKDTTEELDSFQYYLKGLRMRGKIFQYPMETKRLLYPLMLLILIFLCFDLYYQIL